MELPSDTSSAMNISTPFEPYVKPVEGRTLVVGSYITKDKTDRRALYADAVGVDMRFGPGVDLVLNLEERHDLGVFDHIECLSVLEHSRRPWLLAANLERMLRSGGSLHVEVPFNWWPHAYPDDYFRMSLSAIRSLFPAVHWQALMYATHGGLTDQAKGIPRAKVEGHRYYAHSMSCGFGIKQ